MEVLKTKRAKPMLKLCKQQLKFYQSKWALTIYTPEEINQRIATWAEELQFWQKRRLANDPKRTTQS